MPEGYGYDYVNADALLHELNVSDGRIITKSGMSYRVLALDPYSEHMSLPVLRRIRQMVKQGAIVVGPKPTSTPSLSDDNKEFHEIVEELWGTGVGGRTIGASMLYANQKLSDAFASMKLEPDFDYTKPESDTRIIFVHRKLNGW